MTRRPSASTVRTQSLRGKAPAAISDADLFKQWQADVQGMLAQIDGGDEVGLAIAREGDQAWLTIVRHRPSAVLVPAVRTAGAEAPHRPRMNASIGCDGRP